MHSFDYWIRSGATAKDVQRNKQKEGKNGSEFSLKRKVTLSALQGFLLRLEKKSI